MNQRRDDHAQGVRISSQTSGEDEEICSNKAIRGSSDPGFDDLGQVPTPFTGSLLQEQQTSLTSGPDTAHTVPGTLSLGNGPLMGLTLAPLPSAMLPSKKRPLDEVLSDETPPEKDKMAAEIDQIAGEAPLQPHPLSVGSSETAPGESHRQKRSKVNEAPSTPQALPIDMRNSATNSDRCKSVERRSEHAPDASRPGSRATSN
ncbi:hypothetical protein F4803DRAFT_269504 [Xylaria telfairii]|nr:hypothetical protein F4803DRAFT_269504 [Xylaria telfairii]